MQHYAALGGDAIGAAQVNLDVTDRPSDVYSFVAAMVEDEIKKDMANGVADVEMLSGKVSRKVVKQTVRRSSLPTTCKFTHIYHVCARS